jgi:hypothetical protein
MSMSVRSSLLFHPSPLIHPLVFAVLSLSSQHPVRVLIVGGSNCGGAYLPVDETPWPETLEAYLNEEYPIPAAAGRHIVRNNGLGGSGSCTFAPRMQILLEGEYLRHNATFDIVIVELGINDAQFAEQGWSSTGYSAAPPLGNHYQTPAVCHEVLIRNVLQYARNPNLALLMVELPGFILKFSNAGEMHHTIANFYQIPYISLKDAIWPQMRSQTGIFKGLTEEELQHKYWPVDG